MELVAWNWADLLLGLWVLIAPGSPDAGPWDYVDQDGRSARLTVADGGERDGKAFLKVTVVAQAFRANQRKFTLWVHRDGEQVTVLEGVSLDAGNPVCVGEMPSLAPDATWMVSGKKTFTVVKTGPPGRARVGAREVDDAQPVIYRCDGEYVRALISPTAGICRLERLEKPVDDAPSQSFDVEALRPIERAQLVRTGKALGKPRVSLLARPIDAGAKAAFPWLEGERPIDPSVELGEIEKRTYDVCYEDREDLLLHMETIRRAVHYLMAKDGALLAAGDEGLSRVRGLIDRQEKMTLYRKAEKEEGSWSSWFDMGWTVCLAHEAGLSYENEGITYLVMARRGFPEQPVIRLALSFAFEQAGLEEDAAEQMLAALDLSASGFAGRDRLLGTLRAGRDDATWRKAIDDARGLVERLRPPVRVRVVLRNGQEVAGELLEYGASGYRVKVGREVRQFAEADVDHVVFEK